MSVEKVTSRVHQRDRASSPDPLLSYDLERLDGQDVALPAPAPQPATARDLAVGAFAKVSGLPPAEVDKLTPDDLAALVLPTP